MMTIAMILKHKGYDVVQVAPTATIAAVTGLLAEREIGAVVVRDAAEQMLGILSERDIVRCLAREGARTLEKTAAQLMTPVRHTVDPMATVAQAMTLMTENRVRHLPVLGDSELIGIVSIGDVVKARLAEQADEVDNLKAYVAGAV